MSDRPSQIQRTADASLPASKDRQYFAELVIELERRLDVNQIRTDGIALWPMVRWVLARGIKGTAVKQGVQDSLNAVRSEKFTGGREERKELMAKRRAAERARNPDPWRQIETQRRRLSRLGPCDYLVFSKVEKYYQPVGDKFYAPIVDPVYEDLTRRGKTRVIALEPLELTCVNEPVRLSIEPYMRVTGPLQKRPMPPDLLAWEARINGVLEELCPDYHLDMRFLFHRLNRYRRRVLFFRDILDLLQPRAIFFSSFVGWTPLVLAAKQTATVSVDIQHGGQSPYHYHTTHWTAVPSEGYELLPDVFWVWGQAIKEYIDPWLPGSSCRHLPVVGGHRYVAKWKNAPSSLVSDDEHQDLQCRIRAAKKVVLVTLGYSVDEILPECVTEAIGRTPDWLWLLRMHPINRGQAAIDEIRSKTSARGIVNVEYGASTRLPLYSLLSQSDFHVTPFSTTCREAQAIGVDSAIVHPIGATYFKDEIERGYFAYADNSEELLSLIQASSKDARTESPSFIEVDDALVDDVVREVEHLAKAIRPSAIFSAEDAQCLTRPGSSTQTGSQA